MVLFSETMNNIILNFWGKQTLCKKLTPLKIDLTKKLTSDFNATRDFYKNCFEEGSSIDISVKNGEIVQTEQMESKLSTNLSELNIEAKFMNTIKSCENESVQKILNGNLKFVIHQVGNLLNSDGKKQNHKFNRNEVQNIKQKLSSEQFYNLTNNPLPRNCKYKFCLNDLCLKYNVYE